jgi:hypothetical protein
MLEWHGADSLRELFHPEILSRFKDTEGLRISSKRNKNWYGIELGAAWISTAFSHIPIGSLISYYSAGTLRLNWGNSTGNIVGEANEPEVSKTGRREVERRQCCKPDQGIVHRTPTSDPRFRSVSNISGFRANQPRFWFLDNSTLKFVESFRMHCTCASCYESQLIRSGQANWNLRFREA